MCLGLLVMAHDVTADLMLPMLFGLVPLYQWARRHSLARAVSLLAIAGAIAGWFASLVLLNPEKILAALGKDSSLSGRTDIWSMVWQKVLEHPLLGHGYSAFWLGWNGRDSADIWLALHWPVPHSHNGFLDLLADLGFLGLVLFLAGYVSYFRKALRCARASRTSWGLFPLLYLSFMIVFNFSESSILKQESVYWVLYAATWVLTTRWLELAALSPGPSSAHEMSANVAPVVA